jgi:hypothetical protein
MKGVRDKVDSMKSTKRILRNFFSTGLFQAKNKKDLNKKKRKSNADHKKRTISFEMKPQPPKAPRKSSANQLRSILKKNGLGMGPLYSDSKAMTSRQAMEQE